MIDQIRDFLAAGPERRKAMEAVINSGLHKYLGPTGIPQRIGAASEVFNPVVGIEQAGTASRQMMDPRLSLYDRIGAGGRMASEIAGVAAPAGAARLTGIGGDDAARALEEALTGFSARPGAVAAKDFAGDEAGAIRAWHGSPHDFDKFSMDKIGTGEGAQAYGHGLYFAESPSVARTYQAVHAPRGQDYLPTSYLQRFSYDKDAAVAGYLDDMGMSNPEVVEWTKVNRPDDWARHRGVIEQIKSDPSRLYEVEIDANPEDFLDWDAPLSEQPKVKSVVDRLIAERGGSERYWLERLTENPDGQKVVRELTVGGGNLEGTFREAGIPGIRYLDQGSRGAGDGTRNYVVFDDNLVSIIKKYGIAGAAGMLGMSASELQAQINQQQPAPLDGLPR